MPKVLQICSCDLLADIIFLLVDQRTIMEILDRARF